MSQSGDDSAVAEVSRTLAANLRTARDRRGWTLDDLAQRSGVSRGMIHQIENRRTHPSVATLTRLCTALDVPLTHLVELPPQIGRVAHRADAIVYRCGADGRSEATLLVGDGRHELWTHTLHPGDEIRDDGHPSRSRELIHVVSGTLSVEVGPATFTVVSGDALTFRGDRPHAYRNLDEGLVHYTVVVMYGGEHDDRYPVHPPSSEH
jgi:transcriptional regulator with XRE-family HTH domain